MGIAARRLQRRKTESQSLALSVSNVQWTLDGTSITLTWQTNKPADSRAALYYGPAKHCSWNWQLDGPTLDKTAPAQVYDFVQRHIRLAM